MFVSIVAVLLLNGCLVWCCMAVYGLCMRFYDFLCASCACMIVSDSLSINKDVCMVCGLRVVL